MAIPVIRTVNGLRAAVGGWRADGERVALVPTMGALHEGHLSLCRIALEHAERLVVSIFVNPAQFAPTEDFKAYPRPFEADVAKLAGLAHAVYAPAASAMYPEGFATRIHVGGASEGLCADTRPHFFDGVATVVAKLFLQCQPDAAVFGEKDYQQLLVIRRLAADLDLPIRIIGAPVVREFDGLALSSRNAYLTEDERKAAPRLYRTLRAAASALQSGASAEQACGAGRATLKAAGFAPVDYLELRDAETLAPLPRLTKPARLLVAAWLGKRARLIDNIAVDPA